MASWNDEGKNTADYTADTNLGSQRTLERSMQQLRKDGLVEFRGDATQTGGYYLTETFRDQLSKN
jgi:ATP-dependent DNA helicase RecG